jgi:hypothetical protein
MVLQRARRRNATMYLRRTSLQLWRFCSFDTCVHNGEDISLNMLEGLAGKRLLILEEGVFLDRITRRMLEAATAIVERASGVDAGLFLGGDIQYDGVIIDIYMDVDIAFWIVEQLEVHGVPFLFAVNDRNAKSGRYSP